MSFRGLLLADGSGVDEATQPLTFKNTGTSNAVITIKPGLNDTGTIYAKKDGASSSVHYWHEGTNTLDSVAVTLGPGESVQFYGNMVYVGAENSVSEAATSVTITGGEIIGSGNVTSLFNFSETLYKNQFHSAFARNTTLVRAPCVCATTVGEYCCHTMFNGCTALRTAALLRVALVGAYAFQCMYNGCTSLVQSPPISVETAGSNAFTGAFSGTPIRKAPLLNIKTAEAYALSYMFSVCKELVSSPDIIVEFVGEYAMDSMFLSCTALQEAPAIKASVIYEGGCQSMFRGCTAMTKARNLYTKTVHGAGYYNMYAGSGLVQGPVVYADYTYNQGVPLYNIFYECYNLRFCEFRSTNAALFPDTFFFYWDEIGKDATPPCTFRTYQKNRVETGLAPWTSKWTVEQLTD